MIDAPILIEKIAHRNCEKPRCRQISEWKTTRQVNAGYHRSYCHKHFVEWLMEEFWRKKK